jgi:hypothetical protein
MPGECGKLGLAVLAESSIQFWEMMRETDRGSSLAKWLLHKTIQSGSSRPLGVLPLSIVGFAEESEVIFLRTDGGVFMIHLDTMKDQTHTMCILTLASELCIAGTSLSVRTAVTFCNGLLLFILCSLHQLCITVHPFC